jgi:uncharacterized protein (TIGR02147 family)
MRRVHGVKRAAMEARLFPKEARQYLRWELQLRQQRNPAYSLRAFARDLDMGPSTLCEVLSGRLGLSRGRAEKLSHRLHLSQEHRDHFLDLLEQNFGRKADSKKAARWRIHQRIKENSSHLPLSAFEVIADWYHFPILELLELDDKFQLPREIGRVLGLKIKTVNAALERMQGLGILVKQKGLLKPAETMTFTADDVPSQAVRQAHTQVLSLAQKALSERENEDRDNLSVFLSIPRGQWKEFCTQARAELMKVAQNFASHDNRDSLIALVYHTFPIYFPDIDLPPLETEPGANEDR